MLIFMCAYVYIVTFAVFPGVTNLARLTFLETNGPWFQIFWVTLMNCFDTVGRYLGGQPWAFVSESNFIALCLFRTAQIPVFLYFGYSAVKSIQNDILSIINLAIFALGNGYL